MTKKKVQTQSDYFLSLLTQLLTIDRYAQNVYQVLTWLKKFG